MRPTQASPNQKGCAMMQNLLLVGATLLMVQGKLWGGAKLLHPSVTSIYETRKKSSLFTLFALYTFPLFHPYHVLNILNFSILICNPIQTKINGALPSKHHSLLSYVIEGKWKPFPLSYFFTLFHLIFGTC